jgi:hypothetical protein
MKAFEDTIEIQRGSLAILVSFSRTKKGRAGLRMGWIRKVIATTSRLLNDAPSLISALDFFYRIISFNNQSSIMSFVKDKDAISNILEGAKRHPHNLLLQYKSLQVLFHRNIRELEVLTHISDVFLLEVINKLITGQPSEDSYIHDCFSVISYLISKEKEKEKEKRELSESPIPLGPETFLPLVKRVTPALLRRLYYSEYSIGECYEYLFETSPKLCDQEGLIEDLQQLAEKAVWARGYHSKCRGYEVLWSLRDPERQGVPLKLDPRVTELEFKDVLSKSEFLLLMKALETHPSMETLRFRDLDDECAKALGQLLRIVSLRDLYIGDSPKIGDEGVVHLAVAVQHNKNLQRLKILSQNVTTNGMTSFFRIVQDSDSNFDTWPFAHPLINISPNVPTTERRSHSFVGFR